MSGMKNKKSAPLRRVLTGAVFITCGIAMIATAVIISVTNIAESDNARKESERLLDELNDVVNSHTDVERFLEDPPPPGEMKVETVEDADMVGVVTIPSIGISLPVMNDWSYPNLRKTACRYSGSVEDGNLIVLAHNYTYHFGKLKKLKPGDIVEFRDNYGQTHIYTVSKRETLGGRELNKLVGTDYPLTLFTCTYGGASRVVVRCSVREQPDAAL